MCKLDNVLRIRLWWFIMQIHIDSEKDFVVYAFEQAPKMTQGLKDTIGPRALCAIV